MVDAFQHLSELLPFLYGEGSHVLVKLLVLPYVGDWELLGSNLWLKLIV